MKRNATTRDEDVVTIEDLSRFLDAVPAPFVVYDPDERILACNCAYKQEYHPFEGRVRPGVSHTDLQWLKVEGGLDSNALGRADEFVRAEQDRHRFGPETEEWQDDNGRFMRLLRARLPDGHVVGMRFDITDLRHAQMELEERNAALKKAQGELERVARFDELTQLANRRAASEKLAELASNCKLEQSALTLILVDLDGFKQINDGLGHAAGDSLLVEIAKRLVDCYSDADLVARMGGDEFLIAYAGPFPDAALFDRALESVSAIHAPIFYKQQLLEVGASVGLAAEQGDDVDPKAILSMADFALYRAKEAGGNSVRCFDSGMKQQAMFHSQLHQDLMSGALSEQFVLFYQPIVQSANQGEMPAVEALIRWDHPEFGLLAPDRFFRVVENLKVMSRLDEHVLELALTQLDKWAGMGIDAPKVSVNVSPQRLMDPGLLPGLDKLGVPGRAICFEILETVFADANNSQLQWNIDGLHEMGIELQIDDYGTSRSSISSLLTIRPSRIKIDRQFCGSVVKDPEARDIVRLTVALASALGISVTGEGVETAEIATLLGELGCDRLQGYLFGKPACAEEFTKTLIDARRGKIA